MFCWASMSSCFSSFACRFMKKEGYCIEISVSQSKNGKENSKGTSVFIFFYTFAIIWRPILCLFLL